MLITDLCLLTFLFSILLIYIFPMYKKLKLSFISGGAMLIEEAMFFIFAESSRGKVYSRGYVYSGV